MNDQTAYFRKRMAKEQTRAESTARADVRRVHLELASLYAARLGETSQPLLQLVG